MDKLAIGISLICLFYVFVLYLLLKWFEFQQSEKSPKKAWRKLLVLVKQRWEGMARLPFRN